MFLLLKVEENYNYSSYWKYEKRRLRSCQVSKPNVIFKEIDGVLTEPIELATVDVADEFVGVVIEKLGIRKGELLPSPRNRWIYKIRV